MMSRPLIVRYREYQELKLKQQKLVIRPLPDLRTPETRDAHQNANRP